jgi:hypothetical protein
MVNFNFSTLVNMSTARKSKFGLPTTVVEPDQETGVFDDNQRNPADPRIRCPHCDWSPKPDSRWQCVCKHHWNTFDTGGICPACMFQWTSTQCLSCGVFSAHSAWYTHPAE